MSTTYIVNFDDKKHREFVHNIKKTQKNYNFNEKLPKNFQFMN